MLIFPRGSTRCTYNRFDSISKNLRTVRQVVERNYGFYIMSMAALVRGKSSLEMRDDIVMSSQKT